MRTKIFLLSLTVLIVLGMSAGVWAAEKVKLGSAIKTTANYYLPILAAEEKGFWKAAGVEVEWFPFRGTATEIQGVAAGAVKVGLIPVVGNMQAAGRGLPVVMVAELVGKSNWYLWVRSDSRIRGPATLKGAKIGVPQLGGSGHGYGRLMLKALGMEKDVRFVGTGGIRQELAALKTGAVDGIIEPLTITIKLRAEGQVREPINISKFLPQEWMDHTVFSTRDFIQKEPDQLAAVVKGVLRGANFARAERQWTMAKMKELQRFSDAAATLLYEQHVAVNFSKDGKINRKAVENLRSFLIQYEIIEDKRTPPVDELFTNRFTN
jgi:NitT/TauT family transport system substrate-binding protein